MGSVEDHYAEEERRREQYSVDGYNERIDAIVRMVPVVVAHLTANPLPSHNIGWYLCDGELRAAWKIFDRSEHDEGVLLFSDGRLAQSQTIGTDHDHPGHELEWFDPQHVQTVKEQLPIYHGAYEGLKIYMPPPPVQRKWWQRG